MPDLEPVDVDFADRARHVVRVERIVDAAPAAIWDVIIDTSSWTDWFPTMSRADSPAQHATLGSARTVKVGPLVADETVVVADAPSRWGFTVTRTNLPMAKQILELLELEDVSSDHPRTRVTYIGAFEPFWFNRPLFGMVKRNAANAWRHGLDGLASHVATR